MFELTSSQTIALKLRVLYLFKAVQESEKRRKQEVLGNCEQPSLGQLEYRYGNMYYKLRLGATITISAHDIRIFVDSCEPGIPKSLYKLVKSLFLHYGGFQDENSRLVEEGHVPHATVAAQRTVRGSCIVSGRIGWELIAKAIFNRWRPNIVLSVDLGFPASL